jgi:hypothetical protein
MKAICINLFIAFLLCVTLKAQNRINFNVIRETVKEEMKELNIPGASIAVIQGDSVLFLEGFG